MASGLLIDYLGSGVIADRPAAPTLFADSLGLWWATDTTTLSAWDGSTWNDVAGGGGSGDVVGPASSVDNRIALFDGVTGKLIKDGGVLLSALATLASPTFTGVPAAPTAAALTNTTQLATTAFVTAAVAAGTGAVASVNGATGAVVLTEGDIVATINDETASYTAVLSDEVVIMDSASANNFTVPPNSSVAFPIGCSLEVWQKGAGQTTIVADVGVTILYAATYTLKLKEQNSGCSLRKVATDTWRLIGDMEPL